MTIQVIHGDMLAVLPTMAADSVESCVTDPPYHLTSIVKRFGAQNAAPAKGNDAYMRASKGFMGKQWDGGDVAFQPETWAAILRVLKPGGYLLAFASTRGYHRMVCAIEDAGFIIHPMIAWIFGTGFPKATKFKCAEADGWRYGMQSLKPAVEPICMAQKPMQGTGTANWLKHGVGGVNIDGCRIEGDPEATRFDPSKHNHDGWRMTDTGAETHARAVGRPLRIPGRKSGFADIGVSAGSKAAGETTLGRWPANVVHDGSPEVMAAFPDSPGQQAAVRPDSGNGQKTNGILGKFATQSDHEPRGDSGSAARFFYTSKADADDRLSSKHPTIKPTDLMRWLIRLVTPPGGTVLDPFAGSGSTAMAAMAEGLNAILVEREAEYVADIEHRLAHVEGADTPLFAFPREAAP